MMIPNETINVINKTYLAQLIDSRDTNHEGQDDSETPRTIIEIAHAHQLGFASEIDERDGARNIHELTHPYTTCHVLDVAAYKVNLQVENVLHYVNKSRRD